MKDCLNLMSIQNWIHFTVLAEYLTFINCIDEPIIINVPVFRD
uniref:Uncharacterized protein n=1 Tax=Anguilla anguilla TaxID=7936 RepID=A0A0E9PG58_ANGAN